MTPEVGKVLSDTQEFVTGCPTPKRPCSARANFSSVQVGGASPGSTRRARVEGGLRRLDRR